MKKKLTLKQRLGLLSIAGIFIGGLGAYCGADILCKSAFYLINYKRITVTRTKGGK